MTHEGALGQSIHEMWIPPTYADDAMGRPQQAREESSDLIQTWMYNPDLLRRLAAKMADGIPVVWGSNQEVPRPKLALPTTLLTARLTARL
jgi:hypothetical protein